MTAKDGKHPPTDWIQAIVDDNHEQLAQRVTREMATSPSGVAAESQSWYRRLWGYVVRLGQARKRSP
jgi:hypothetical protein